MPPWFFYYLRMSRLSECSQVKVIASSLSRSSQLTAPFRHLFVSFCQFWCLCHEPAVFFFSFTWDDSTLPVWQRFHVRTFVFKRNAAISLGRAKSAHENERSWKEIASIAHRHSEISGPEFHHFRPSFWVTVLGFNGSCVNYRCDKKTQRKEGSGYQRPVLAHLTCGGWSRPTCKCRSTYLSFHQNSGDKNHLQIIC